MRVLTLRTGTVILSIQKIVYGEPLQRTKALRKPAKRKHKKRSQERDKKLGLNLG